MASICTYVVRHDELAPAVSASTKINGGCLKAIWFEDAIKKNEEMQDLLIALKNTTKCPRTLSTITKFLNQ